MKKRKLTDANRAERLFAYLIDQLMLIVPQGLLASVMGITGLTLLIGFLIELVYCVHFTASRWQATPGQRIVGMFVIHTNGSALTLRDAVERFLAFVMPRLPMYASVFSQDAATGLALWLTIMWFAPILLNEKKMGVHDMLCKTRVIAGKADAA